jgi:hypothetical protein
VEVVERVLQDQASMEEAVFPQKLVAQARFTVQVVAEGTAVRGELLVPGEPLHPRACLLTRLQTEVVVARTHMRSPQIVDLKRGVAMVARVLLLFATPQPSI